MIIKEAQHSSGEREMSTDECVFDVFFFKGLIHIRRAEIWVEEEASTRSLYFVSQIIIKETSINITTERDVIKIIKYSRVLLNRIKSGEGEKKFLYYL